MPDQFSPSEEFAEFFFTAIDHGFSSIEEASGPLIPFVMEVTLTGEQKLNRFVTERLEDGVKKAREYVAVTQNQMRMYAIAWDAFITLEGNRTDAILVEAADRDDSEAVLFCQRYIPGKKKFLRTVKAQRIGNPALIERPPSAFTDGGA